VGGPTAGSTHIARVKTTVKGLQRSVQAFSHNFSKGGLKAGSHQPMAYESKPVMMNKGPVLWSHPSKIKMVQFVLISGKIASH
jgi:hypothetical protein